MKGRTLLIGGGIFLAIFTGALWYFQVYAFYKELPAQPVVLGDKAYESVSWDGIDGTSSPLKRRVCLTVSPEQSGEISAALEPSEDAEPLLAPKWFECFDAKQLSRDLKAQKAVAGIVAVGVADGVDEYLAIYPDGRGYIWRQLQPKYANQ